MTAQINSIFTDAVGNLRSVLGNKLASIILYGSYARGDYDEESDIDIMVLVDIPSDYMTQYRTEVNKIASRLSLDNDKCITVSIMLQDVETFNRYQDTLPFFSNIVTEGVSLYAA